MSVHNIMAASVQAARIGQVRDGVVIHTDPVSHSVKVRLEPDGAETGWMPDAAMASNGLRISCPAEEGTQVKVLPTGGDVEHSVIIARMFDVQVTPPISPVTGKPAQAGELLVMTGQGAIGTRDGGSVGTPTQNAAWYHLTATAFFAGAGNATLTIQNGSLVAKVGGCTMTLSASGLAVTGGTVTSDTDVLANGISGHNHHHGGVQTGSGSTGAPV